MLIETVPFTWLSQYVLVQNSFEEKKFYNTMGFKGDLDVFE